MMQHIAAKDQVNRAVWQPGGFAIAFDKSEQPSSKELAAYGVRWQPYRTAASWYLWRVAERAAARKVMPLGPAEEEA